MANVGDLTAKLTLDTVGFEKGVSSVEGMAQKLAGGIGNVLSGVTAAVGASVAAVAAGVGKIVESSVKSYAEYEQLVGGVETLFKESAGIIEDYASTAYMTAGISANEYMNTVTSFSASLLQSLGGDTEQAAVMADMAITDMADNANKMGSSMESIQAAYQGFAKQNYTMLDNLKLGYGGTQNEMERLIRDAEKLDDTFSVVHEKTKKGVDKITYSFADVVEAIHIVQTEMGITGTTAEEASNTISGSLNMMKASWQDLLTSLSGGGVGLSQAIDNLVNSAETFLTNVIPVVEEALYGIGDLIAQLIPVIAERLPDLIATLAPMFLEAALSIVNTLIGSLPDLIQIIAKSLMGMIPDLVDAVVKTLNVLLKYILPVIAEVAIQLVLELGNGLVENFEYLYKATIELLASMTTAIIQHFPEFLELGAKLVLKIVEGILLAIPTFIVSVGRMLGIIEEADKTTKNNTESILSSVNNTYTDVDASISSMESRLSGFQSDTNTISSNVSSSVDRMGKNVKTVMVPVYDSMGNLIDHMKTTVEETKVSSDKITKSAVSLQSSVIDQNSEILKSNSKVEESMTALNEMYVSPQVDPSGVVDACNKMIESIEKVLDLLEALKRAGGSASAGSAGGGRASGGWVNAGSSYVVGELGPELITPTRSGYVHTAEETEDIFGGAGGGITINIQGDIYDDERSMTRKMTNAVRNVIEAELAYGI